MHLASAHVVGASLEAFRQVWSGESLHSVNIAGGLHHAMPDRASGFCIYNDVAVGITQLLADGVERVAYVDIDVHHGDGVESIFWDDPRVLTISLHETGQMLFPGTGFATDTGGDSAEGTAANVALPPGTSDAGWLRAFHAVVPPLLREFRPEVLVTQHGCDSHMNDPLAHMMLSVDGQRAAYLALHELAHEVAGGKWVVTGGGGYSIIDVVPRAWAHLLAIASGRPLEPTLATPPAWRAYVEEVLGATAPHRMTDGRTPAFRDWADGYDPDVVAGPGDPRHPHGGLPAARPRPASLTSASVARSVDKVKIQPDTPPVPQVSLAFLFPTRHASPNLSPMRHACDAGGEAGAVPRRRIGAHHG